MNPVAADFGGSIPEYYDSILGPAQLESLAAELVKRIPARPPGDVLEIACGTGLVTRRLREHLEPGVRIVATDLSKPMLDYARKTLRESQGIDWREADAAKLPFPDASFGAVVCGLGIMFVPDKVLAFREARRVLRPGGVYAFTVWDSLVENPHAAASTAVLTSLFPGDPEMDFAKIPYGFHDPAVIRRLLASGDFSDVRIEKVKIEVRSPSAYEFATGVIKGTPRAVLVQQRGVAVDEVVNKVAAAFERLGGKAPFRTRAQAIIVEAHVPAS